MCRVDEEAESRECEHEVEDGELEALVATALFGIVLVGSAEGGDGAVAHGDGDGGQADGAPGRGPKLVPQDAAGAVQQVPEEQQPAQYEQDLVLPRPPARINGCVHSDHRREAQQSVKSPRHSDQGHVEPRHLLAYLALASLA